MSNYFEDAIATGQPIVPPSAHVEEAQVVNETANSTEWQGLPVRVSGDKIWLLKGGKRFWVTSKEVYEKLGFKFGDEAKIDQVTLNVIPEGDPLR